MQRAHIMSAAVTVPRRGTGSGGSSSVPERCMRRQRLVPRRAGGTHGGAPASGRAARDGRRGPCSRASRAPGRSGRHDSARPPAGRGLETCEMNRRTLLARAGFGVAGAVLITGVAGLAVADEIDGSDVAVDVEIEALPTEGALTMSVAAGSTSLTEVESDDQELRQFDGVLPTVTVTDDREDVPEGVFWYVTGQSSAFTAAGVPDIGPDQLGWRPRLLTEENGEVAPGDEVVTSLDEPTAGDNNVGLVGEELLALALDSSEARPVGEWEATADLFLKTERDVAPGSYSATLTLTLWEDAY